MVLSNKERQARHRQRLREAASRGVTAEMVRRATRLMYDYCSQQDSGYEPWEQFLAKSRTRKGAGSWLQFVPADIDDDYVEFGEDADLMRSVAAVASAVLKPPLTD